MRRFSELGLRYGFWIYQIWLAITATKPYPRSNDAWLKEKEWYDKFEPHESPDYSDALQYAEKRLCFFSRVK